MNRLKPDERTRPIPIWIEKPDADLQRVFTSAFPGYAGRTFSVYIYPGSKVYGYFNPRFTGASWDGGTERHGWKSSYVVVDLATSKATPAYCDFIPPNAVVVEHSISCSVNFRGKDMGLELHVIEANAARFLPTEVELTEQERIVLGITVNLKSFARREQAARSGITHAIWDTTKTALIERGLLRKNGAVTADGRNAVRDFHRTAECGYW